MMTNNMTNIMKRGMKNPGAKQEVQESMAQAFDSVIPISEKSNAKYNKNNLYTILMLASVLCISIGGLRQHFVG